ncbi:adenylyl-sulfate kinase [Breoghania sp. JC706]|uniref:adenylyl-sulfate kinase n=1 Tax=Breoghania sp. JC706 TaxID=3117732 RepID=UPI00300B1879
MERSQGKVIWITGLSGAGKSTLAGLVAKQLGSSGEPTVLLDGDQLRDVFGATAVNHGKEGRMALAFCYARLCKVLASQGLTVIIATISMFSDIHRWNRENLPGYVEAYLKVPLAELKRRDPKGIYRDFEAGRLVNVAGLDLAVDEPENPDWTFAFDAPKSPPALADELLAIVESRNRR